MKTIYYLGGSPCSGKSTVAELMVKRLGFRLYQCDDHLERYAKTAAEAGNALLMRILSLSPDETWLRDPAVQSEEEFAIYHQVAGIVAQDLQELDDGVPVIAEGAALLPQYMLDRDIPKSRYVCLTPAPAFQRFHYARRPWIHDYLNGCTDPATAFENWMRRDELFAKAVHDTAHTLGFHTLINDGSLGTEALYAQVTAMFGIGNE